MQRRQRRLQQTRQHRQQHWQRLQQTAVHEPIDITVESVESALQGRNLFFLTIQCIHSNRHSFYVYTSERSISGTSIHLDSEVQASR